MISTPGRALPVLALLLGASSLNAQPDLWEHLKHAGMLQIAPQDRNVMLPRSQRATVVRILRARTDVWGCAVDDPKGEWLGNLKYTIIPASPPAKVFLVEAGPGCARGGQGSNGAMWVIRFEDRVPIVLADPEDDFAGFLYSIGPTAHKGYRDIILGWHMSAMETGLTYFRFDGKSYRRIASATLYSDDDAGPRIVPHQP